MKTPSTSPTSGTPLRGTQPHCQTCSLNALCLPLSLKDTDMERLDDIIRRGRPIQKANYYSSKAKPSNRYLRFVPAL